MVPSLILILIENLRNFLLKILGILVYLRSEIKEMMLCMFQD